MNAGGRAGSATPDAATPIADAASDHAATVALAARVQACSHKLVKGWLFFVAGLVFAMVILAVLKPF